MPWAGPQHADDFPSLGWEFLDWCADVLPSPRDPGSPLVFTDEQAIQLVEWFRLDPLTGRLVYRRGYSRRAKGWGKSPVEAAKAIAEFAGPVRFGGWDAAGQPVGMPWGTKDAPRAWVQIGAISEDQTDNTWSVVHYLLTENDGRAADELGIDAGLTRCFLRDQPGAKLEPVTSAAGSREGQPITYGVIDESHLMLPANGGVKLARTIRRNVAKMGGRSYETTNSFLIGQGSVAETSFDAVRLGAPGIFADEVEAPRKIGDVDVDLAASDEVLAAALDVAYGSSWWVDRARLVADIRDPASTWTDSARFFFNWSMPDVEARFVPADAWQRAVDGHSSLAGGRLALAWDVSPKGDCAAISFVGRRPDGMWHAEVIESQAGTEWVPARIAQAAVNAGDRLVAVGVLQSGSALAVDVKAALTAAGITVKETAKSPGLAVDEVGTQSYAQGCATVFNAIKEGQFRHLNQQWLNDAVDGARSRQAGEAWVWDRKRWTQDITPLCSVTVALRAFQMAPEPVVTEYVAIVL